MGKIVPLPLGRARPWLVCCNLRADRIDPSSERFCPRGADALWRVRQVLGWARAAGWTITHVIDRAGARLCGPIEGLAPLPSEPVFERGAGSAFAIPEFRAAFERADRPAFFVVGFELEGAVISTLLVGADEGAEAVLIRDATASRFDKGEMDAALLSAVPSVSDTRRMRELACAQSAWRGSPA